MNRRGRGILAAVAVALVLAFGAARAPRAAPAGVTPAWEIALTDSSEPGRPFVIEGRVFTLPDSQPSRDVTVRIWHADARGIYGNVRGGRFARLEGRARTNVAGGFRVRTVLPGPAEGFAHVHYELSGASVRTAAGTLNLARSHGAGSDTSYAKLAYMLNPTQSQAWAFVDPDDAGYHATIRLYAKRPAPR